MKLTEDLLRNLLFLYKEDISETYTAYCYEDFESEDFEKEKASLYERIQAVDRVLNGKETIELSGDSVWEYFNNILKIG